MRLRQDRLQIGEVYAKINGKSHRVIDISLFGVLVADLDTTLNSAITLEILEKVNQKPIWVGNCIPIRKHTVDSGSATALEVKDSALPVYELLVQDRLLNQLHEKREKQQRYQKISNEALGIIAKAKEDLTQLKDVVEVAFNKEEFTSDAQIGLFQKAAISTFSVEINGVLRVLFDGLIQSSHHQSIEEKKLLIDYAREQLSPIIYQSAFAKRSYTKPLGYAGDFEMMNIIYRNENVGKNAFEKCVEAANQMFEEPQAVRNRIVYLGEKIAETLRSSVGSVKILSVACGPAKEIVNTLKKLDRNDANRLDINLLDQDENALKDAHFNITHLCREIGITPRVNYIKKNISEIIRRGVDDGYQLIYSAGLFDYFEDNVARLAAKQLMKSTDKLIIGNFDSNSPNHFGMVLLYDWFLILRGSDDLQKLYGGLAPKVRIEKENQEVNLFCVLEK